MGIIKTVISIVRNPFYIIYIIFQYPLASICTLFIGFLLIKWLFKSFKVLYTGNQDMHGKTVLITGATVGTGKATAFDLAKRNARLLLACRNVEKGERVAEEIRSATGNQNIIVEWMDLCSFASVRQFAERVLEREKKLHVLINHASIIVDPRNVTEDGCDVIMQTNYFGPFLLTLLLLELLKRSSPSRIINLTAFTQTYAKFDIEDLNNNRRLDQEEVYYISKLANILFTKELSKRLLRTGVTVNCVYPGFVPTEAVEMNMLTKFKLFLIGRTYEEAAQNTIQLAVDPLVEKTTGKVFQNCMEMFIWSKYAGDMQLADRLFELSGRIVGLLS